MPVDVDCPNPVSCEAAASNNCDGCLSCLEASSGGTGRGSLTACCISSAGTMGSGMTGGIAGGWYGARLGPTLGGCAIAPDDAKHKPSRASNAKRMVGVSVTDRAQAMFPAHDSLGRRTLAETATASKGNWRRKTALGER